MPDARAVEVHYEILAVGPLRDANDLVLGDDGAVERVLECDDLRGCTDRG